MIRKIMIATISVLLSASILFIMVSPLIPIALDVYFADRNEMTSILMITGVVISFILATTLTLICVLWKNKIEDESL